MFFSTRRTGVHARLTLVGMIAGFALAVTALQGLPSPANAAVQTFTINPNTSVGPTGLKIKHKNLNKNTKQYFLIRTYLEYFEKVGGGKLILSKGTYRVPNTLYVGSNVTIHLNSGAILAKWNKTKGMKVAASMFQTIRQSKSKKKGYYGGYNGEKNITFEGDPGSFFDLNNFKTGLGIVAGHTQNLTVKGIGFREMNYGHYIEISATKHTIITGNAFGRTKAGGVKEAINIDTPDRTTGGVGYKWTKFDKTPNDDVLIERNSFRDVNRAVGTHKFSRGHMHNNIRIIDNTVTNTVIDAFQISNWKNSTITGNTVVGVGNYKKDTQRAFLVTGGYNNKIACNVMDRVARPIGIFPWQNSDPGKNANGWIYPTVTAQDRLWFSANRLLASSSERDARYYTDRPTGKGSMQTIHNEKIDLSDHNVGLVCTAAPKVPSKIAPPTTWQTPRSVNTLTGATGKSLSLTSVGTPMYGSITLSGNTVVYTPTGAPLTTRTEAVPFTLTDSFGRKASSTITFTIVPPAAPTAESFTVDSDYRQDAVIDVFDGHTSGNGLTVVSATDGDHGTVTIADDVLTYAPTVADTWVGPDSFDYTVHDLAGRSATATITVNVASPEISTDYTSVTIANRASTDIDWRALSHGYGIEFYSVGGDGPVQGQLTRNGDLFHYVAANTDLGYTDVYTFKVSDETGQLSDFGSITIHVDPKP